MALRHFKLKPDTGVGRWTRAMVFAPLLALAGVITITSCTAIGAQSTDGSYEVAELGDGKLLRKKLKQIRDERKAAKTNSAGGNVRTVNVSGKTRSYIVHFPDTLDSSKKTRVLLAYHPALGTAEFMEDATRLHEKNGSKNFIVVYPEGQSRTWNAGECCGLAEKQNANDLGFFDAIMADLATVTPIAPKAYVTGYSNGSMMAYWLLCNRPSQVAAVAAFAAYLPSDTMQKCPAGNVSLLHLHGDADKGSPVDGGKTSFLGNIPPASATVETIAIRNKCDVNSAKTISAPKIDASCVVYSGCASGAEVRQCLIPNLGHSWPGMAEKDANSKFAPARPELQGSDEVLDFFLRH